MTYHHSPGTRELIASLAPVVCPADPDPRLLAQEIAHHVELSVNAFSTPPRVALVAGLRAYDNGARVFPGARARPARELEGAAALRYFERWWHSPLALQREFARGLKGLICLAYYETPSVKAHIGYTPEAWIERVTTRRLSMYSEDIERQREANLKPDPLPPLIDAQNEQ